MDQRVSITCPECRASQQVEQRAMVAVCARCQSSIRCVDCAQCGHCFAALEQKKLQCPRCLRLIRTWKGSEVPFQMLAEQRGVGVAPVDAHTVAATTPELFGGKPRRSAARWIFAVVMILALGVAAFTIALLATRSKAVSCPLAGAKSTLTYTTARDTQGDYRVDVIGHTMNTAPRALHDVVVTWVVTYADGSTGKPTATSLPSGGTVAEGSTVSWGTTSSTNDGRSEPTGVKVLHTYTTAAHPTCLT